MSAVLKTILSIVRARCGRKCPLLYGWRMKMALVLTDEASQIGISTVHAISPTVIIKISSLKQDPKAVKVEPKYRA
ncbi:hypothetical protein QYF36_023797 [Acer negundo]|nr:hypothetical protein QYF36_023797 [Acer negundo]